MQYLTYTVQFSSVAQSFLTLCYPMDCSTPGFPVHHQLPELTQTQMSGQVSRGSIGEYQADEQAGVAGLSWRLLGR